jgi:hypothetical protein
MFERIRLAVLRYIRENLDDLLALDLKIARLLGAPAPHTISGYSHIKWTWLEPTIDFLALWIFKQKDHCRKAYEKEIKS